MKNAVIYLVNKNVNSLAEEERVFKEHAATIPVEHLLTYWRQLLNLEERHLLLEKSARICTVNS